MGFDPRDFLHRGAGASRRPTSLAAKPLRPRKLRKPKPIVLSPARCVLTCDPSINDFGWAVTENSRGAPRRIASGVWHPSKAVGAPDRFAQLESFVRELVRLHPTIEAIVVEGPNHGGISRASRQKRSIRNFITYGRAVGNVEAAARATGRTVYVPDVNTWKDRKRKTQTADEVRIRLGYTPSDHNESDALGLALWFFDATRPSAAGNVGLIHQSDRRDAFAVRQPELANPKAGTTAAAGGTASGRG